MHCTGSHLIDMTQRYRTTSQLTPPWASFNPYIMSIGMTVTRLTARRSDDHPFHTLGPNARRSPSEMEQSPLSFSQKD